MSAEAFILSQKKSGWDALPTRYDDGGFTVGNEEFTYTLNPVERRELVDRMAGHGVAAHTACRAAARPICAHETSPC